jgi:hypothetical protein
MKEKKIKNKGKKYTEKSIKCSLFKKCASYQGGSKDALELSVSSRSS